MADNDEAEIKPEETLDVKENLPGDGQTPVNHTITPIADGGIMVSLAPPPST